jgi:hypothetical protein
LPRQHTLEDGKPPSTEFGKGIALHHLGLDRHLAEALEQHHAEGPNQHEDVEEGEAGQEQVGRLDAGSEGDSLDAINDVATIRSLNGPLGKGADRPPHDTDGGIKHWD